MGAASAVVVVAVVAVAASATAAARAVEKCCPELERCVHISFRDAVERSLDLDVVRREEGLDLATVLCVYMCAEPMLVINLLFTQATLSLASLLALLAHPDCSLCWCAP